jgi:CubicO group peptidase (beta-lactamase class C family)
VEAARTRLRVPGVAVGLITPDGEWAAGLGVTNVEHPLPVDADTLFQIGSVTKTLTMTAVLRLASQRQLDLDTPIRHYLPDLRLADLAATDGVTLRLLLTHRSGLPADGPLMTDRGDDALADLTARLAQVPILLPPGFALSYSNLGLSVAGRVIEAVTGRTYEGTLKELLLDPLGMGHAFFFAEDAIRYATAVGHADVEGSVHVMRPWQLPRIWNPAGGLVTSARDLLRHLRFWLGDGSTPDGRRLVSSELMAEARSSQTVDPATRIDFGLSWALPELAGVRFLDHTGTTIGQTTKAQVFPTRGMALCVLTNAAQGDALFRPALAAVAQDVFGVSLPVPSQPTPYALTADRLAAYAGRYENPGEIGFRLTVQGDGLQVETRVLDPFFLLAVRPALPPEPPFRIVLSAADRFYAAGSPSIRGAFLLNSNGDIRGMFLNSRFYQRTG